MDAKSLQNIFIKILRSELTETELDSDVKDMLTPEVISDLYYLSKYHDLAHIVSSSLMKNGISVDDDIKSKLSRAEMMSVYRVVQLSAAYDEICGVFDKSAIPYIPLKGSIIRPYYPKETMRTSCDIDILIKEADLKKTIDSLVQNGYECAERNYHDVSLYSPSKVHLELHFSILENSPKFDTVLQNAWEYAIPTDGCRYEFSKDFFIFHQYAHMAYHFLSGGCGIRSLMDIWVIEHKMGVTYELSKELLEKAGIYKFAEQISKLANICFSNQPTDEFSENLLTYIFSGGVYGTGENHIAIQKTKSDNLVSYALKRLFLPYRKMTSVYPILKKIPVLLPFCWVARFFRMLFGKETKRAVNELRTASMMSDDKINSIKQMCDQLGLDA